MRGLPEPPLAHAGQRFVDGRPPDSVAVDPDRVRTVTFDRDDTIVDVDAAERALADRRRPSAPIPDLAVGDLGELADAPGA